MGCAGSAPLWSAVENQLRANSASAEVKGFRLGDAGATALADALKENTEVKCVNWEYHDIGDVGAMALANALKVNTSIEEVRLRFWFCGRDIRIGDEGAKAFGEALRVNKSVKRLDLEDHKIGDLGACVLFEALLVNETLEELNLGSNKISDLGAVVLAEVLKVNSTIKQVRLNANEIGDSGALALAKGAQHWKKSFKDLFLVANNCIQGGSAIKALDDARRAHENISRGDRFGGGGQEAMPTLEEIDCWEAARNEGLEWLANRQAEHEKAHEKYLDDVARQDDIRRDKEAYTGRF